MFRKEFALVIGNLNNHKAFWEQVMLKDHPFKDKVAANVKLEEFMNYFTSSSYQGMKLYSVYPKAAFLKIMFPLSFGVL